MRTRAGSSPPRPAPISRAMPRLPTPLASHLPDSPYLPLVEEPSLVRLLIEAYAPGEAPTRSRAELERRTLGRQWVKYLRHDSREGRSFTDGHYRCPQKISRCGYIR